MLFSRGYFHRALFIWPAKPAQSRPSLKRVLNKCRAAGRRDCTFPKSQLDGTLDRLSAPQRAKERKIFRLDAAKIDGEVQAMNGQKDLRRFKLRNGPDLASVSAVLNGGGGEGRRV